MREGRGGGSKSAMLVESPSIPPRPPKLSNHLHFYPQPHNQQTAEDDYTNSSRHSSSSATPSTAGYCSPSTESSPLATSPWSHHHHQPRWSYTSASSDGGCGAANATSTGHIGSLVREDGHIYSLAAASGLLYTGSDSKNIRVWRSQKEFSGFKASSGLVKAIVVTGDRVFTGHQDGKIRVWRVSPKNATLHKRVGSLPRFKDFLKSSLKPSNYIEVRRHRRAAPWIRHTDAVSCLSMSEDQGLLYSGSWDSTFKVWRVSDSKCLESVAAHDDAVNSVAAAAFDGLVFTASADGTVKAWRMELRGKGTCHAPVQTLLRHDCAVTALAVSPTAPVVYCASSDGVLNFWEWEARQLSHGGALRGHSQSVLCLAAAGSLVLSGSADATICVWRREGGAHSCLSVLRGHAGPVKCLAVEPDRRQDADGAGRWIVYSGSLDKSVRLWRVLEQPAGALLRGPLHVPAANDGGGDHQLFGSTAGQDLDGHPRTHR